MTVSASGNAWSFAPEICDVRVYRAPRESVFGAAAVPTSLPWVRDARLRSGVLRLTDGPAPASLHLRLLGRQNSTRGQAPNALALARDLDPTGTIGPVPTPHGWQRLDAVKLCLAPSSAAAAAGERCLYVGYLVEWTEDLATGAVDLAFADARWLLERIAHRGAWWWDETGEARVWIEPFLAEFNPRGKKNLYRYWAEHPAKLAFVDEDAPSAVAWQRGLVWNYLRRLYNVSPPAGIPDTRNWFDWPESSAKGWGSGLWGDDDGAVPGFGSAGDPVLDVMNRAVCRRGDLSWTLAYDGASGRARPVLFGTGVDSLQTGQRRFALRRGEIGQSVSEAQTPVIGGRLRHTAEDTVLRQHGFGARKRLDISFDTVAGTLEPGWTTADETAWLLLDEDEAASQYPSVFLRWVVPAGTRWASSFGWAANLVRARQAEAELASLDGSDTRRPIRLLCWRKVGAGDWERVPEEVQPRPCRGALGIEFPVGAREEREHIPDEGADFYTWDGAADDYHFRVTLSVEADELLAAWQGGDPDGWPLLERAMVDDGYEYHARREAYLNLGADGEPTADGPGTGAAANAGATLCGSAADDAFRDDSDRLADAVGRLASRRIRTTVDGSVELSGLRADLAVGDYLDRLEGGGATGTRPDWVIASALRGVELDFSDPESPRTRIEISGD